MQVYSFNGKIVLSVGTTELVLYREVKCTVSLVYSEERGSTVLHVHIMFINWQCLFFLHFRHLIQSLECTVRAPMPVVLVLMIRRVRIGCYRHVLRNMWKKLYYRNGPIISLRSECLIAHSIYIYIYTYNFGGCKLWQNGKGNIIGGMNFDSFVMKVYLSSHKTNSNTQLHLRLFSHVLMPIEWYQMALQMAVFVLL